MTQPNRLPETTRRLFAGYEDGELLGDGGRALLIGRLLEEGDSRDLRWLMRHVGEDAVALWLSRRAGRQLSSRSRAFWLLVLGPTPAPARSASELWPL